MTTIVVPLDGSVFAERAIRPAVSMAARLDQARVLLLHCAIDDVENAQRQLDDRASLFTEAVDVEVRIVDSDDPAAVILATAVAQPDGLICMATHGRGGLRAALLGSVAAAVVRESTQPIVLIGPNCRTVLLPDERGRLLACSDGSAASDSIIPTAITWCDRLKLEPWLVEVVGPDENPEPAHVPHPNREVEAAQTRLDVLATRLGTSTAPAGTKVLNGAPSSSITWFAEQLPAGLIAMTSTSRSGLARLTMGSVATEVVRHAPCPVLVTRPTHGDQQTDS